MNYGYVIKRAWEIIWKEKTLFLFAVIGSFGAIFSIIYSFLIRPALSGSGYQNPILLFIGYIAISVVNVFISALSMAGIIKGTLLVEREDQTLSFNNLFQNIKPYIWRLFGLNIILTLVSLLTLIFQFPELFSNYESENLYAILLLVFCSLFCFYLVLIWAMGFVIQLSNVALLDSGGTILEAMKNGWEIFRKNFGIFIVISIAGFILGLILGFILMVPLIVLGIPLLSNPANSSPRMSPDIFLILFIPVYWLFMLFFNTYLHTFWTLLYLEIKKKDTIIDELEPETI